MKNKLTLIFLLFTLTDIVGIICQSASAQYIAKPLLLPTLMVLLWLSKTISAGKNLLLAALFFSWAGDIFLMLENKNPNFFIVGLVCFLTTHIFYIIYFIGIRSSTVSLLKKQPLLILLVAGYGLSLVALLFPHLNEMKLPVIIYATVICCMLLCSLHTFRKVNGPSNIFYLAGAASFVLSDSLLAINKFYQTFSFAGVLVMLTYCAAQYLIVRGFIEQKPASQSTNHHLSTINPLH